MTSTDTAVYANTPSIARDTPSREIPAPAVFKRDRAASVVVSAALLIPVGLASFAASFFILPAGIITIICSAALLFCASIAFIPKARVNCPFCGRRHVITRGTRAFRCGNCGNELSVKQSR
ncbi:MAG: transposase [Defluviitaleaceae bacterium]|nr:transposase [Defluviitaleaceae bacterium]